MEDRLINGRPAIQGHQAIGILKMFLRKSTKAFIIRCCGDSRKRDR
jgi:hypothetical protein